VRSENVDILKSINVAFPKNQSTVIMGPSGCGKSTLLKVAAGILIPDGGRVYVEGEDLFKMSEKQARAFRNSHGFVFQDAALWGNKTVFENLSLPIQIYDRRLSSAAVRDQVNTLLNRINMIDSAALRPSQLSFGERKAISLLRAIILEPTILFMDDPTAFIDHVLLEKLLNIINELKNRGCTIIAVTHNAHLTSMIANYLVILKRGMVLEAEEVSRVRRSTNPEVMEILSQVLSEAATYDTDLLDLLDS